MSLPTTSNSVWSSDNFRRLFAAQVISLLGSGVTTVGLALFAYKLTNGAGATAVVGNALTLRILAFLIFSQPAGILADRVNRRTMLIAADVIRAALLAVFPWVTELWQIYALIFVINAVTAFFTPTFEASIPDVVGAQHYVQALSYARIAVDVEAAAAPALAGALVLVLGPRQIFLFDAATYLISAMLVSRSHIPQGTQGAFAWEWRKLPAELSHGTRVLLREPALRQALVLSVVEAIAGASAIVVTVTYVRDVLHRGDATAALVTAAVGLGSAAAAFVLGRVTGRYERRSTDPAAVHERQHRWAMTALLAGGWVLAASLLPGALVPPLILFAVLWILNGAGQALIAIPSTVLLAGHVTGEERGRAYAAHFALTHACWLGSYPAVGHAAKRWGAPLTFSVAGVVCAVMTALAILVGRGKREPHVHVNS